MKRYLGKGMLAAVMTAALAAGAVPANVLAAPEEKTAAQIAEEKEKQLQQEIYNMPIETNALADWPQGPGTYGDAAIVMEVGTGAILYAKNIDAHEYPASITKVLTALVALENGKLTDPVKFSHDCVAFMQPGDSSVGLKEGNEITLEQAMHAMMLASANEAAYAIGENVGKNAGHDYDWFIEQMNAKCKELGGENSHFANTNGLHDPDHYTCARDMALIGREIFKYPEFFRIVQTMQYTIPASATTEEHIFQQKHKMMKQNNENYYEYVIGGKTGFTSDALSTLITMADNGETQLVCVVLRTRGKNIYPDTRNLFEYVFHNFKKVSVDGKEESEDIEEILEDENSGYVMLPEGIDFSSLDMELIPDETERGEATLNYTYEGQLVGSARAKLSRKYLKAHSVKVEKPKKDKAEKKDAKGWSLQKKIKLGAACVVLLLLIRSFIVSIKKRRRRHRRRRRRR